MSDILPEIIEQVEEIAEEDAEIDETENIIKIDEDELVEEVELPEVEKKELVLPSDVFAKKDLQFKKELDGKNVPVIKPYKRTRKMTPKALESLAKSRIKALEQKKINTQLRKEGKMVPLKVKRTKIQLERIEAARPIVNNVTHETKNITNNITHEDIQKIALQATREALEGYETVRKERKEIKKKKNEIDNHHREVQAKLRQALGKPEFDRNSIFYGY